MDKYERIRKDDRARMRDFKAYLNNLKKKSKDYLVGMIEGMLLSGQIKIEGRIKD